MHSPTASRRSVLSGLSALAGLALMGCGSRENETTNKTASGRADTRTGISLGAMSVYRDPSCGCCKAWADIARKAGYQVTLVDRSDMPKIKQRAGVPDALASCHTAIVDGYAVEGHVPLKDVARLLKERPSGIKGIAVPGMPRGSPGMEMPDGSKDQYRVVAFDAVGRTSIYRS